MEPGRRKPDPLYLASFVAAMIAIPVVTTYVYYNGVLGEWLRPNPVMDFQNIKESLVRYGNLSQQESERFSSTNFSNSNNSYPEKAVELSRRDLDPWGWGFFLRVGLPTLIIIGLFVIFTLTVDIPGISKDFFYPDRLPKEALGYVSNLPRAIITVDGFIISILGASLVSSGLGNFYFFLGFETIIFSLISCLASYPFKEWFLYAIFLWGSDDMIEAAISSVDSVSIFMTGFIP